MDEVSHAGTGGCLESWRVWVQPDSVVQLALVVALGGLRKEASWKSPSTEAIFHENCDLSTFFPNGFEGDGNAFFFFLSSTWESNLSCRELPNLIPVVQTLLCFGVLLVYTAFGDHHYDLLLPKSEVFNSFLLACFNIYYLFIYLFSAVLGLHCFARACGKPGLLCCHPRAFHCGVLWSTDSRAHRLQWLQHVGLGVSVPRL